MIIDNFLESYAALKRLSLECAFEDYRNPADGVVYPHIFKDLPEDLAAAVVERLSEAVKAEARPNALFLRMNPAGVRCPHPVHHDACMGAWSLMLYLNDGMGGTGLLKHRRTGIAYAPEDPEYADLLAQDQHDPRAWDLITLAPMKQNRAFIFDARHMHCALPIGGFGKTQQEARIVLTCFFTTQPKQERTS